MEINAATLAQLLQKGEAGVCDEDGTSHELSLSGDLDAMRRHGNFKIDYELDSPGLKAVDYEGVERSKYIRRCAVELLEESGGHPPTLWQAIGKFSNSNFKESVIAEITKLTNWGPHFHD